MDDYNISPFNRISPVVLAFAGAIVLLELAFSAGASGLAGGPQAVGWRLAVWQTYAFPPEVWGQMVDSRSFDWSVLMRLVTYPFMPESLTNALFSAIMIVALGKGVSDAFNPWAFILLFLVTAAFGAVVYATFSPTKFWLGGAMPACYGLIGAITFEKWREIRRKGGAQLIAFRLIGVLLLLQLIWNIIAVFRDTTPSYLWVAELSAFALGFALTVFIAPGGKAWLLGQFRRR